MDQVADWRRPAGLGVFSSSSPVNSSPAVAPANVPAGVETPVSCSSTKCGSGGDVPVQPAKPLVSTGGTNNVSPNLMEKKAGGRGGSTSASASKGRSPRGSVRGNSG